MTPARRERGFTALVLSGDYSVKVGAFDTHHKRLFEIMNTLHDAMSSCKGRDAEYNFEGFAFPKAERRSFVKKAVELREKLDKEDTGAAIETMRFLKDWFSTRVLDTDRKYSGFFNEKGVV